MRGSDIRLLTTGDLDAALALSSMAGWNQRLDDWRMLLRQAPGGAFAAVEDGTLVGTSMALDYGGFAWIAMMLVDPACRGRGLGGRLLEAALDAVPAERPVRLDATPLGRPLYARYGFVDEAVLTRHAADRPVAAPGGSTARSRVRPMDEADLPGLLDLDSHVFGGSRGGVLEWAHAGAPGYARVLDDGGSLEYCLGRTGRLFDQIGPVVASSLASAESLIDAALLSAPGRPVIIDAYDDRGGFAEWLGSRGFTGQRPLYRMRRPGAAPSAAWDDAPGGLAEFAILGPEFA